MKHRIIFLFAILNLLSGCAHQQTSQSAPSLELYVYVYDLEQKKFGNQKIISVNAHIRNIGTTTVTLPTKTIISTSGNAAFVDIVFSDSGVAENKYGFSHAKSLADFAPAEVRPGEHITVSHTFDKPAPAGARITYRVSKEFADRYHVWHGELVSDSLTLKDQQHTTSR